MSGLEVLFIDGGATVSGLAAAALSAIGYKQSQKDDEELAKVEQLPDMLRLLQEAHAKMDAKHSQMTSTWRCPLSLFGEREASAAASRGVPSEAIAAVWAGQRLVDEAAALVDRCDVYEAQLSIAIRDGSQGKGLLRAPVCKLTESVNSMSLRLERYIPRMVSARKAFDAPQDAVLADLQVDEAEAEIAKSLSLDLELPIAVLRDRGRLGELWRLQGETMSKLFKGLQLRSEQEAGELLPPDVEIKMMRLRSNDEFQAMSAAWALGRIAEPVWEDPRTGDLCVLHDAAVRKAVVDCLCASLLEDDCNDFSSGFSFGRKRSTRHASVRKAAVEALGRIADPSAAPALCQLMEDRGEDLKLRELIAEVIGKLDGLETGHRLLLALQNEADREAVLPEILKTVQERCRKRTVSSSAEAEGESLAAGHSKPV
eukprot:gnl/TRDRNA2_/TRDRNA2_80234_c0_seq1.p1 gnl/TRDRNA2_/TRDRNA2_80234_c0~~gnl/TRDRNA2_/TRDRNA2_80234_c0_seq1.p1  ORF type:complete len:428 (+),score=95.29 gnl/TRDRNA2_/TRDRNA2_80234_c0_seq1:14-1297(+)